MVNSKVTVTMLTNSEKEVHMIGGVVAVCWPVQKVREPILNEQGRRIGHTESWERTAHRPYIGFVGIHSEDNGFGIEDEDNIADYGITQPDEAEGLAEELRWAAQYLRENGG